MRGTLPSELPSRTPAWFLILTAFLILATAATGFLVLYDDHAVHLGVGVIDASEFNLLDEDDETYTAVYEIPVGEGFVRHSYMRYSNGTTLSSSTKVGGTRPPETPTESVLERAGVRYESSTYVNEYSSRVLEPDVYFDEATDTVYEKENVEEPDNDESDIVGPPIERYRYVENGSQTWRGNVYTRYDVLDPRSVWERLTGAREVRGYLLVDEGGKIRYGELGYENEDAAVYMFYEEPRKPVPSWSAWIDSKFEVASPDTNLSAYREGSTLMLLASDHWTPEENTTLALIPSHSEMETKTLEIEAGETVLRKTSPGTYIAYLHISAERLDLTQEPNIYRDQARTSPRYDPTWDLILDVNGLNLAEIDVQPSSHLGNLYSVTAAHLKPENGGGRVLRVDSLALGDRFDADTNVTVTVSNASRTRSIIREAGELSSERFFLIRTLQGLETVNSGGIAVHVSPSTSFADRRFVANATMRITADGVPIYRTELPKRVTQDSDVPLDQILMGVAVRLYETPPERRAMLGQGRVIRSMNWSNHVLLKVHSWDYDYLRVEAGEAIGIFRPVRYEDETGYYRLERGERYSVSTEDGRVLVEGRANGSLQISP